MQNKFLRGAFATFLGLTISAADEGTVRWRAVAVVMPACCIPVLGNSSTYFP